MNLLLSAVLATTLTVPPQPNLLAAAAAMPPVSEAKLSVTKPQPWHKRHPAGTVALSIIGGAVLGAVSCHNGWIICGDDDETGHVRTIVIDDDNDCKNGHGHCGRK